MALSSVFEVFPALHREDLGLLQHSLKKTKLAIPGGNGQKLRVEGKGHKTNRQ